MHGIPHEAKIQICFQHIGLRIVYSLSLSLSFAFWKGEYIQTTECARLAINHFIFHSLILEHDRLFDCMRLRCGACRTNICEVRDPWWVAPRDVRGLIQRRFLLPSDLIFLLLCTSAPFCLLLDTTHHTQSHHVAGICSTAHTAPDVLGLFSFRCVGTRHNIIQHQISLINRFIVRVAKQKIKNCQIENRI